VALLFWAASARAQELKCAEFLAQIAATFARPELGWKHPLRILQNSNNDQHPAWLETLEDAVTEMYQNVPPEVRDWNAFATKHELSADAVLDLRMYYGLHFFDFEGIIDHREDLIAHAKRRAWEDYTQTRGEGEVGEQDRELPRYGLVKRDGQLLEFPVKEVIKRSGWTAKYLARKLQVPLIDVQQFVWNHQLEDLVDIDMKGVRLDSGRVDERTRRHMVLDEREVTALRKIFAKRVETMDRLIDYLAEDRVERIPPVKRAVDDESPSLTNVLGVAGQTFENEYNPSRFEAMKRTRARLQWRRGDFALRKFRKVAALLDAEIARLSFDAMGAREKNFVLQDRLIDHLLQDETESFPSLAINPKTQRRFLEDALLVSDYRIFWGTTSNLGPSVNKSREKALRATLARLETRRESLLDRDENESVRDYESREENYRKAHAILSEELLWSEFSELEAVELQRVMRDQLIDHLARREVSAFPEVGPESDPRFSDEAAAAQKVVYRLLYESLGAGGFTAQHRLQVVQALLERATERRGDFKESVFEKISAILHAELRKNGFVSKDEMNLQLQDHLIDHLMLSHVTEFPQTTINRTTGNRFLSEALGGVDYRIFLGHHPEAEKNLNASRGEAMRKTLMRLNARHMELLSVKFGENVPLRLEMRMKNFAKALKILEEEVSRTETWGLDDSDRNRILQDRLIDHLVRREVSTFPSTSRYDGKSEFDVVLDYSSSSFLGTRTPEKYRLSANRVESLERCLKRLDQRVDLSDEARAKARALISEALEKSRQRKPRAKLAPDSPAFRKNR
jgi:hypothetical protein